MSKVQAVLLAGGQGSRLRPYTTVLPKPLLPVGEWPIAEIIVRQLKFFGITNIVISTGHLASLIETFFGDGKRWGVHIRYVREDKPLGTAGALRLVNDLADDFLVMNGDILSEIDFRQLSKFHKKQKATATIACQERTVKSDFGVVKFDRKNILVDYLEKPEHKTFVSMGINVLSKQARSFIRSGESLGMPDLMLRITGAGEKVACYRTSGLWLDLGRREDLDSAQEILETNKKKFHIPSLREK